MAVSVVRAHALGRIRAAISGVAMLLTAFGSQAAQIDWVSPPGSVAFGSSVAVLPNGNIVVTDPCDPSGGAAYLYSPSRTLISKVVGVSPGFSSCSANPGTIEIHVLKNGNYLLAYPRRRDGSMLEVGMVAWASGTTGLSGVISDSNALLGSRAEDRIGSDGITLLANGHYVIGSSQWDNGSFNGAGAATWGNGNSGVSGRISASNSLVGTSPFDSVGNEITALTNGNYVVNTSAWRNAAGDMVGATTWGNGATGIKGTISAANSLVGSQGLDGAVSAVTALTNGNYVVALPGWDNGSAVNTGAVVWGNGTSGIAGIISPLNALIGGRFENRVGFPRVVPLTNGNYVVSSSLWEGDTGFNLGAVTWANGSTGLIGVVSELNSLVGDFSYEYVGDDPQFVHEGVVALANGNYVVSTPRYGNGANPNLGAVTWGNGATGTVGVVSASNSLTGSTSGDFIGVSGSYKVTPLTNGNYVVISAKWQNEQGVAVGAATWVNGSAPHSGVVSSSNSVPGISSVIALTGGDFVVSSREWVTRGNGATGTTAELSLDASLATDAYSVALPDGSYVVCSQFKDNAAITQAGAVTWSAANTAVVGEVSAGNSLVGTTATDNLCRGKYTPGITPLADSRYVVYSSLFDNGALVDAEAMTLGVGSLSGGINLQNSVIGTQAFGGNGNNSVALDFDYDVTRSSLVVGHHFANRVTTLVLTNDVGPVLTIGDVVIAEGNSGTKTATFTVQLSAVSASPVNYDIATANGRATAGSDYVARQLLAEVIPAGVTSKTFAVTINADAVPEASESFTVNVSNVVGAKVADAQAIGRITNDDDAPLNLSMTDASVTEGNSGARKLNFTASLSAPAGSGGVTFTIATGNVHSTGNAATANSDFASFSPKAITIAAGETSASFSVKILGDTRIEADELFKVIVSNVVGASVARAEAVGTIINDDDASLLDSNTDATVPSVITAIASIQGTDMLSPMMGRHVIVQGVITAVRQDGFFLQTPDAKRDANPATSDAIFVFTGVSPNKNVSRGNLVEVSGQVREVAYHSGRRELTSTSIEANKVTFMAARNKLPQAIVLNASMLRSDRTSTWLERFESMRVSMPKMRVVSPTGGRIIDATAASISDGRFHGVADLTARPFQGPGILETGESASFAKLRGSDGNSRRVHVDSLGQAGSIAVSVDVGDVITGIVGVLAQANDSYSLFTDTNAKFQVLPGATPRAVSTPLSSDFTIGHLNARRFFDNVDDPEVNEPVLTEGAYALRLAKTANAICRYMHSPDIVGVAEVEKQSTLSDLAEAVNSHAGNVLFPAACKRNPEYRAVMANGKASNGRLGFLVSTANVRPGVPRVQIQSVTDTGKAARFRHVDGSNEALFEQSPLLLRAKLNAADGKSETLTVIVNQLQPTHAIDDPVQASGGWLTRSDYIYAKRRAQMQFLVSLMGARQAGNTRERIVVLGGFESNEFSNGKDDLMGLIAGPVIKRAGLPLPGAGSTASHPLINMTLRMPRQQRYSVLRGGNAEAVDHVLVSKELFDGHYKLRTEFARINADFGEDNAGDFEVPVRVSDHDAAVLYLSRP